MKLLSWNIRGIGRPAKRRKIRKLLLDKTIDMVLLQETKQSSTNILWVKSIWPRDKFEFMAVDAEGLAGGLICIWDPDFFHLSDCCCTRSFILLSGKIQNSFDCVIINIYASNDVVRRKELWVTLLNLKHSFPKPWCLGGDFNEIRTVGERIGVSCRDRGMKEFNQFIDNCELVDVPMIGRKFTWCNALDGNKWSRIDRFLISPEWLVRFKLILWGLPRTVSDHCPLVLMEDGRDWGPKPYKFLNAWLLHPNLASIVETTWRETQLQGSDGFLLKKKLQALKMALKKWSKEVYGNVANKLKDTESVIHELDLLAEIRPLEESELTLLREKRNEKWSLNRKLEWEWLQKSRMDWTLKGDRNTKFSMQWQVAGKLETPSIPLQ
ncbi:uncharacterized protein LOC114322196 [Camellia sinensis]|uniref:uncharacterized protein LOC114322196 n=1 Tax=Camellia sinensis TaxID=4442 RepID=UPI001035558E|nr:uncharacterized protein LOC114322196 [Camellia sinensis]